MSATSAQPFNPASLHNFFDSLALHQQAMGSLAISQGGELIYTRAIGFADPAMKIPATTDMVYRTGSITKTFTAVIIHQLANQGLLNLDDQLSYYYPTIPNASQITLAQMLRHQSGIANYTEGEDVMEWITQDHTPRLIVQRIQQLPAKFDPGKDVSYSNSNFLLLGYIAERVSGKTYRALLRDFVLEPAGLPNTYYAGPIDPARNEVISFEPTEDGWAVATQWSTTNAGAAGAISSTPADLNTFYRKLLRGELLPPSVVDTMKVLRGGLGQGLFQVPFKDQIAYGHNGGIDGFSTISIYFPEQDLAVTYLGNGERYPVNDILIATLSLYHSLPYQLPDFQPAPEQALHEPATLVATYSSEQFPLDVTIYLGQGKLFGQATGQGAFPLKHVGNDAFTFEPAGIRLEFDRSAGTMLLLQGGNRVLMTKQ